MENLYFTADDEEKTYFPLVLLRKNDIRMPIQAKYLYALLYDALADGFQDKNGTKLVMLTDSIRKEMHTSDSEIENFLTQLEAANLIERLPIPSVMYLKKVA